MKLTLMLSLTTLVLLAGCSGSNDSKNMPNIDTSVNTLSGVYVKGHKCELTTPTERKEVFLHVSADKKILEIRDFVGSRRVTAIGSRIEKFQFLTLTIDSLSPLKAHGLIKAIDKAEAVDEGKFFNAIAYVDLNEQMVGTIKQVTSILDGEQKVKTLPSVELGKLSQCEEFEGNL